MNKYNHEGKDLNECLGLTDKEIHQAFSTITQIVFKDYELSMSKGMEALEVLIEDPVHKRVALLHLISFMTMVVDSGIDMIQEKAMNEKS